MPCDPKTLATNAVCIDCGIPTGMQDAVIISLLAQIAGVPLDAPTLVKNAVCIDCGIPQGYRQAVIISLLCKIAGV